MSTTNGATILRSRTDTAKDRPTVNVAGGVVYSKIAPHTAAAGDPYYIGDAYDKIPLQISQEWETDLTNTPYLAHVKAMSTAWPHLRYLADFMDVSTTPLRWKFLRGNDAERVERSGRTNAAILDFPSFGKPTRRTATSSDELEMHLNDKPIGTSVRLIIVEDLSRQVIEILGGKFDVDPGFFREHINDYSWYNIRDRWMSPPSFKLTARMLNWTRVRFVRPRYFKTNKSFQISREESNRFNVLRRGDDDQNQFTFLDGESIVSLTRTRMLLWLDTDYGEDHDNVGILLVDPTVKEGHPLWHGYRNWARIPGMNTNIPPPAGPPRTSLFEDIVYWTMTYPWFSSLGHSDAPNIKHLLAQPTLYIACAEWNIMCEYIKARLGQIEWQLGFPEQFGTDMNQNLINHSVKRLHAWRRLIPLYREMLTETVSESVATLFTGMSSTTQSHTPPEMSALDNITSDFEKVSRQMKELQDRTDRLTSVVMAAISIEDSRRGLQENQNVARLTWLATVFIPLAFITGLFSMQQDLSSLKYTFGWYFAAAIPVTALALGLAMKVSLLPLPKSNKNVGLRD